ncbi:hypothetical protein Droror1_Dr00004081 [Drosera rotundifolia]
MMAAAAMGFNFHGSEELFGGTDSTGPLDLPKSNNPRRSTSPIFFSSVSPSPAPEFLLLLSSFTLHLSSFLSPPLRRLDRRPALPSPPFPPLPAPHLSPQKSNLNPKSMMVEPKKFWNGKILILTLTVVVIFHGKKRLYNTVCIRFSFQGSVGARDFGWDVSVFRQDCPYGIHQCEMLYYILRSEHLRSSQSGHYVPGVFFFYDISPIKVTFTEKHMSFLHFITNVCAIVGGIFTVSGIVDSAVYHGQKAIRKKT